MHMCVHVFSLFNKKRSRERYCSEQIKIQVLSSKIDLLGRNSCPNISVHYFSMHHFCLVMTIIIAQELTLVKMRQSRIQKGCFGCFC